MTRKLRLGEVINIKHGFAFPGEAFGENPRDPILVTPGNFALGGGFRAAKPKTFSGSIPAGFILEPGSLIITMTDLSKAGDTLGLPAIVPGDGVYLHNQRIGLVEAISPTAISLRFLAYYLRTNAYRSYVLSTASGSTVRHTSPRRIAAFEAVLPELAEQRAIAEVLGALDDKIAANRSVAEVGEELLGAHFDRLGLDGEDPDSLVPITSLIELNPLIPRPIEAEPVYVDMQALPTNGMCISSWSSRPPKGGARFQNGDTLLARITPCLENRKTGFVDFLAEGQVGLGSTEYVVMRTRKGVPPVLSYFLAVSERFRTFAIRHMVGTSGRQRVGADVLREYEIRLPGREELERFGALSKQIASMLASVRTENQLLAETRDVLLPQLMSGRLRVKDAEKQVEAVV
ncbi:MAG TPA: restriction endonuclease subunit S [Nakamurella multipartita]|nr:restriction endonuclease subunit S [Nakamurella multipartita]